MSGGHAHSLTRWAWLSIAAAVVTIGLKTVAYLLTGSVGLLSDALVRALAERSLDLASLIMWTWACDVHPEQHGFLQGEGIVDALGAFVAPASLELQHLDDGDASMYVA